MSLPRNPPTLRDLFAGFFWAGILGFGGVLPLARRMIVEERRWLSAAEFTDLLALCQFLPGPNICNLSVALGARFQGATGSFVAVLGLLTAPVMVALGLAGLYARYGNLPVVQHGFIGLSAAASGLILGTALKIAWPIRANTVGLGVAGLAVLAVAVLRLPLLPTMLVLAPLSILLARAPPATNR